MADDPHHVHLVKEVEKLFSPVLKKSPQAIYIYLDDEHKTCNERFAKLLGYKSPKEWIKNEFPLADVLERDQNKTIKAYVTASEKLTASTLIITIVTKKNRKVKVKMTMAPFVYKNEVFVIHFISKV